MLKKEEIYVTVESKEQAEMFRKVLEAMGENIKNLNISYFDRFNCNHIGPKDTGGWWLSKDYQKSDDKIKYQEITFGELIDLLQIKPLYKSNDGFDVFEDDLVWIPQTKNEGGYYDEPLQFNARNTWAKNQTLFIEKQAALEWIEAQKPKSVEVKLFNGGTANLYKNEIVLHGGIKLSPSDLEDLIHAYNLAFREELQNA